VEKVKLFYPEFDLVIVDSDSTDLTYFELVDVKIEFCKNKNWEIGAWCCAFEKYPDYEVYMFIQDTLVPKQRIPNLNIHEMGKDVLYSFHFHEIVSTYTFFEELKPLYKDTPLSFISEMDPATRIVGTAHTSFLTRKENVDTILQLEDVYVERGLQKTKKDSWMTERTGGIMADRHGNTRIDVTSFFHKIYGGRDSMVSQFTICS
jgi:hypothetical protein